MKRLRYASSPRDTAGYRVKSVGIDGDYGKIMHIIDRSILKDDFASARPLLAARVNTRRRQGAQTGPVCTR